VPGGGTWMGINDFGVASAVLNRRGTLGPKEGLRSRGELPLEALEHDTAASAAAALAHIDTRAYRSFNLIVADSVRAFLLSSRNGGDGSPNPPPVEAEEIPVGLSMITASDMNDPSSARIRAYLPRFRAAPTPNPDTEDWTAWELLLASRHHEKADGPEAAMNIVTDSGFGTVCSSLLALPEGNDPQQKPVWIFAAGPPDEVPFRPVDI
jgi:transport and Golgi organization protein 2